MPGPNDLEAAFDRLFDAWFDRLRRFAYRYVRSWEDADDVVHDVFVRLWSTRDQIAAIDNVEAYLHAAVRNRALSRLKHLAIERRWKERASRAETRAADPPVAERQLEIADTAAAIQRALDTLSPRQRDAVLLLLRGKSYNAIAAALGISPKTVSVHLSRAFDALRDILPPLLDEIW